jgi:sigma-B regulation protein RsbU (phosphoserine phosphatase)
LSATSEAEDVDVRLSLIDDMMPRMVLAAPIAETSTGVDVLYVDQSALHAMPDALGFFAIVARMVNLARSTLIAAEEHAERKVLDHQLETAKRIQSKLTPKKLDFFSNVASALYYEPALWVGGDYCDVLVSSDNRLVFAVGDVSGKGLPAAMVMANLQAMLRSILLFNSNPVTILDNINDLLCDTLLDGMFITLLLGFFDPESGELEYVNAGHELPLLISQSGAVRRLGEPVNYPLGILKNQFVVQRIIVSRGESLLVVSDGVTETLSPESKLFGIKNLIETVENACPQTCQEIVDAVVGAIAEFRRHRAPTDDVTVLALKRL